MIKDVILINIIAYHGVIILPHKRVRKTLKFLETKYIPNHQKAIIPQTKQTFIILMTHGL